MDDKYKPFVVGGDGEIVVHGDGPGDAEEAVRRANRRLDPDRPTISRRQYGDDHVAFEMSAPAKADRCPHCHMVHPIDLPAELEGVDCRELIASAREMLPSLDPDAEYSSVVISVNCAASAEELRQRVETIMDAVPGAIGATVAVSEETFLSTVAAIARTTTTAELMDSLADVIEESDTREQVKRDARNN